MNTCCLSSNCNKTVLLVGAAALTLGAITLIAVGALAFRSSFPLHSLKEGVKISLITAGSSIALISSVALFSLIKKSPQTTEKPSSHLTSAKIVEELTTLVVNRLKKALRTGNEGQLQPYLTLIEKTGLMQKTLNEEIEDPESPSWKCLTEKMKKWANKTAHIITNLKKENKTLQWATGTRSVCLIGLDRVGKNHPENTPALIPSGYLPFYQIAPLTGELGNGVNLQGINRVALSGVVFNYLEEAVKYAEQDQLVAQIESELQFICTFFVSKETFCKQNPKIPEIYVSAYFSTQTFFRVKIAVLRLLHLKAPQKTLDQAKNHLISLRTQMTKSSHLDWKPFAGLLGRAVSDFNLTTSSQTPTLGSCVGVKRSDGRVVFGILKAIEENHYEIVLDEILLKKTTKENVEFYDEKSLQSAAEKHPPSPMTLSLLREKILEKENNIEELDEILSLFERKEALALTDEEKSLLNDSYPIVWASTSPNLPSTPVLTDIKGEYPALGILKLGEQIDFAITKQKKIDHLTSWLKQRNLTNVQVLSKGSAYFLRLLSVVGRNL